MSSWEKKQNFDCRDVENMQIFILSSYLPYFLNVNYFLAKIKISIKKPHFHRDHLKAHVNCLNIYIYLTCHLSSLKNKYPSSDRKCYKQTSGHSEEE